MYRLTRGGTNELQIQVIHKNITELHLESLRMWYSLLRANNELRVRLLSNDSFL